MLYTYTIIMAKVIAGTTVGLQGVLVQVEVDVSGKGFPTFTIVGLPGKAIDEAKDRVRTAITNAGYEMPDSRLTVNLAPADVPKSGSVFDLAIALGILIASGIITQESVRDAMYIGELSLEGEVRGVTGILPLVLLARQKKLPTVFLPAPNASEASVCEDVTLYPVSTLSQVIAHLNKKNRINPFEQDMHVSGSEKFPSPYDFLHIQGQEQAKRALEIAAAGFHNVHMRGSPGAGKTILSRSLPTILPPLEKDEMLEVANIYSITSGLEKSVLQGVRPFRAPHHTTSRVGLIGGGSNPSPGEISLAHRGVLFLDEFPEFPRHVLESLRQPLEDGIVTVSRASGSLTFPARFLLLAASNPCPCGYFGHPKHPCKCVPGLIVRYKKRLSGPLLDRIDLHIDVPPVEVDKLTNDHGAESSLAIQKRVIQAHSYQQRRFAGTLIHFNSEMSSSEIRTYCVLEQIAQELLSTAVEKLMLSARSYFKVIKVARTIADLDCSDTISKAHIAEALQYRVPGE